MDRCSYNDENPVDFRLLAEVALCSSVRGSTSSGDKAIIRACSVTLRTVSKTSPIYKSTYNVLTQRKSSPTTLYD